ncbi:hypothetical protein J7K25_00230 [bacterium]|nr:hypothetical protein [bacterium]
MEKKDKLKETVSTIVKPVSFFLEKFNQIMKGGIEKEEVKEVDGFVYSLLEEAKDLEEGMLAFFAEILFMNQLTERTAEVVNEITLAEILGERIRGFVKTDIIRIYLLGEKGLSPVYSYPYDKEKIKKLYQLATDSFKRGESLIFPKVNFNGKNFAILSVPLRTTKEKFGQVLIGKRKNFSKEEIPILISGCSIISFIMSNMRLTQEIIKNEKLVTIGKVISGLSHDIKNYLQKIENGIYLIENGLKENDQKSIKLATKTLKNSYEKMKNLVLSMIDYSRERELNLQLTDINKLIDGIIKENSEIFKNKKIKTKKEYEKDIPKIYIDPYKIERAIINLLINATDAVDVNKGVIKVGTKYDREKEIVEIWVEDNGCGINEKNLDKIFDIFYSTKGARGTGFGLAIVQKVIKEHNGIIEVKSKVGQGTKFILKIPARKTK